MAFDPLYATRLQAAWQTGQRYAKRAVAGSNSLGLVVLYFLAAFLYMRVAESLTGTFWTQLAACLLTAVFVAPASVRTFLRKADLAMLAPSPYPMKHYLRSAFVYSLLVQAAGMLLLAAIVYPVYKRTALSPGSWALLAGSLILLKMWCSDLYWRHVRLERDSFLLLIARWGIAALFLYGFWTSNRVYAAAALVLMVILTAMAMSKAARYHLPWLFLIEKENKRIDLYYTILNMFIDVPHKRKKVRPRTWAIRLFDRLTGDKGDAYLYVLVRHVIRTGETFAIYLRLAFLTLALIAWAKAPLLLYALCLLGLAAAVKQVTQHIRTIVHPPSIRLLPIASEERQRAAFRLCLAMLGLMTAGMTVVILSKTAPLLDKLALIAICWIWTYLLTAYFFRRKKTAANYQIPLKR
ncbi:ABC transporter permease [Brevibacillus sp. FSL L8-0520]|uniref:ABC transporter permease n=1 Tax=Brevibacillus sp. FSL L8-0520 TaxID=2954689 RepID=UPI0030CD9425